VQLSFLLWDFKQDWSVSINCRAIPQCHIAWQSIEWFIELRSYTCDEGWRLIFLQLSRHEGAKSDSVKLITGSRYSVWPLVVGMLVLDMVVKCTKTTNDQSTQIYFIWNVLHVSDHSINRQVSTDLKFIGKCNSDYMFQTQYLWDPTLKNKYYNKIVICK
jgi:hypothetical protein